jgi:hypothetical protein
VSVTTLPKLLAASLLGAALVAVPAAFAYQPGYGEHRTRVCTVKTIVTSSLPATAVIERLRVFANGREINGQKVAVRQVAWSGRGVAVVLTTTKMDGPLFFRVANMRLHECSRVRITYRWSVG